MKRFVISFLLMASFLSTGCMTHNVVVTQEAPVVQVVVEISEREILPPEYKIYSTELLEKAGVPAETFALPDPLDIQVTQLPTLEDFRCMRRNLYHEARGEGEVGMKAVAAVTMNRTRDPRYPKTVCGVVEQKARGVCQFSWVCDRRIPPEPKIRHESERNAWELAGRVAMMAFNGTIGNLVGNATHYHATYVRPRWARKIQRIVQIGTHIFYYERLPKSFLISNN